MQGWARALTLTTRLVTCLNLQHGRGVYRFSLIVCFSTTEGSNIPSVRAIRSCALLVMSGFYFKADGDYKNMESHELHAGMDSVHDAERDIGDSCDPLGHVPTKQYLERMGGLLYSLSEYVKHTPQ